MSQQIGRKRTPRPGEIDYNPEWANIIKRAILEYMEEQSVNTPPTSKELIRILGIKPSTLVHWQENYVEVRHALETGLTQQQIEIKRQRTIAHSGENASRSKYRGEVTDDQIFNYCLLGARDEDLCKYFEINSTTLYDWRRKYPGAEEACRRGRDEADSKVARSLYKRATGYTTKKMLHAVYEGQITDIQEVDEEVIPDVGAAKYWLSTRQRAKWADNQFQQVQIGIGTDNIGQAILESETFRKLASALLQLNAPDKKEEEPIEVESYVIVEGGDTDK